MEQEEPIIQRWINAYLEGDISRYVFTCLMMLFHIGEKEGISTDLKGHLNLAMIMLKDKKVLTKKEEQRMDGCLADIMKIVDGGEYSQTELDTACDRAMEEILAIAKTA